MNAELRQRLARLRQDAEKLATDLAYARDAAEPIDKRLFRYPARALDEACRLLRKAAEYGR